MMKPASQAALARRRSAEVAGRDERIAPAPRVSVQAFCETVETAAAIQAAGEDRRMAKAHLRIQMGGLIAAIEAYQNSPTPNVIILESENRGEDILAGLDQLAPVCDAATRVIIIGRMNDVALYRELVRRGVSDYLIAPVGALQVVRAVCGLFSAPDAKPVGRIIAVVGAKGGVGASTIAHNIAFSIARDLVLDAVVTDLDLAFGTAGPRLQPGPAAGHRRSGVLARPHRQRLRRPAAVEMHRSPEPAGGAGDAGSRLRFRRRRIRVDLRFAARDRAVRRARRAASVDRLDQADPGRRRRHPDRRRARSRQSAQHQESVRLPQGGAPERSSSALLPQSDRRAQAARDQGRRFRQGAGRRAGRGHPVRTAAVRRGGEQRPDDRGDFREPPHRRDVPAAGAEIDRPRRDRRNNVRACCRR